jgi:superfamily II DNA/RNA helicase
VQEQLLPTFASLGVDPRLVDTLTRAGITDPFPIQAQTIPDAIEGRDVCGKAKTGSGKTLAFGLPLLQRTVAAGPGAPTSLVLVPTRELAMQVCEVLAPLGKAVDVQVEAVYGGVDIGRQIKALERGVELLVATPGRLIDLINRKDVVLDELSFVVVDEADRMADMGFLPQVEWVLRHAPRGHQTLLFSATLDGAVQALVTRYQTDPVYHEVGDGEVTVAEMVHRFLLVHEMDKAKVAATIIEHANRTIVFCNTKRGADRLVRQLEDLDIDVAAMHGDLRQKERSKAVADFSAGKVHALVATDAAARGLDIDDVDVVIHYDPTDDPKNYLHRSGRTARAGASGVVATFLLWNEELLIRRLRTRLQLDVPIVEIFSNDPRLADLADWEPVGEETA